MPTTPSQFRLSDSTLDQIEALRLHLGLASRAEVIRYAVSRLARAEMGQTETKKKKEKISENRTE